MSTDRIIVHSDIAPAFTAAAKNALELSADPTAPAPTLVSAASKARVEKMVSSALASGAHLIHGASKDARTTTGIRMAPMLLGGVTEDMSVWQDEAFASLAACVTVADDEEAVAMANRTGYGLSVSVFTEDLRKGFALAKKLQSG